MMKHEPKYEFSATESPRGCGLYDAVDFSRLVADAFSDMEFERFAEHCEQCDDCSRAFWDYRKSESAEDKYSDDRMTVMDAFQEYVPEDRSKKLIQRSIELLDKLDLQ